jgi:hypothetical protein
MSMTPLGLAIQTVATPGTPQKLSATPLNTKAFIVKPIKALPGTANTGNIYIGAANMVKGTGAGVFKVLATGAADFLIERSRNSGEYLDMSQWYIDADTAGDGCQIGFYGESLA